MKLNIFNLADAKFRCLIIMRILVIEDEHKIANSIKRGLEQENFAVDVVYDGTDGFDMAASEEYDVIILDLMLPGIDGITLCKKLRGEKNHTPILMLTAKGSIADKVEGLDAGADDYLVKPFAFEELLARVRALTRRPIKGGEIILKVEDLELDSNSFIVKRSGKNIILSRKEFALLEFMMRNFGKILTKDKIISHVWDYDSDILPNTIEVYIGYLRKKIDVAFPKNKPLIHTVRGFGYRIS